MNIEIADSKTVSSTQPHFWKKHDRYLKEVDGEPAYSFPLEWLIGYMAEHDTPTGREALARCFGNHGLSIHWGRWAAGERAPGKLFTGQLSDVGLHHFCVLLATNSPHVGNDEKEIEQHQLAFLAEVGVEPNLDRIKKEFCVNCAKQGSPAPKAA